MSKAKKRNIETTKLFRNYLVQLCLRAVLLSVAVVLWFTRPDLLEIRGIASNPSSHAFAIVLFVFLVLDFSTKLTTRSKIAIGSMKQYKHFQIPTTRTVGKSADELFDYFRSLAASGGERRAQMHFHPIEAAREALSELREQLRQGGADAMAAAKQTLRDVDVLRLLPFSDDDLDVSQEIRSSFRKRRLNEVAGVIVAWILLNACIAMALYILGMLDGRACVGWTCLYFVFDMVCVVFWCPLQLLFMRNRCCTTCQIFNWDAIMAVTPLMFAPCWYSAVLVALALVVLLRWEISAFIYPERFFEETNASLSCANCRDKLCKLREPIFESLAPTSKRGDIK